MSQLLQHLRSSGALDEGSLEAAMRRQQIYGGSLDTVLLELDLLEPVALAQAIAAANGCENVPVSVIDPGPERPWDALPEALLKLGWAMPLRRHLGHVQVAIHPEIPTEQRELLASAVEGLQVLSTCEACLAKLAAERRGGVIPQRYAVLALRWKQALAREEPEAEAPAAPWMTAAAHTAPFAVPSPDAIAALRTDSPAQPKPKPGSSTTRNPTFLYGLSVEDDDEAIAPVVADEPTQPPATEPGEPGEPGEDVPTKREVKRDAEVRPSASLSERLAEPRAALEQATGRDETTDALVRAAMVLSPRVALFGLKREGLRGIDGPGAIPDLSAQVVDLSPAIDAAVEGHASLDRATDLDLRIAVGQEMAVPCLFLPVKVHDRPVLMLYVDRNGEPFSTTETEAAVELCEVAGQTLAQVLRRLRGEVDPAPASAPTPVFSPPGGFKPPVTKAPAAPPAAVPVAKPPAIAQVPSSAPGSAPRSAPSVPLAKPPIRLAPINPPPPSAPTSRPVSGPALGIDSQAPTQPPAPPLAKPGSVRGRIVIDDDDDASHRRSPSEPGAEQIDSAIQAAMRGGDSAIEHLRELGEPAYRRITKQFPGELDVHRRDLDTLPPLPAHGALIRVALELPELGPYLVEVVDHPNPTVRFYVAFVFMELRHHRAVAALGECAFDPDADVRAIAMRVLETYSGERGFDEAIAVIRRELDSPNRTRQLHATRAVGTVRDIAAVSKLIELLASKERYIQESALESLCSITGQQLGLKPHRWRSWYADNAHHHRVEWIISSLAHKDLSVRRWAADELRRITNQRINFLAAGSKQEREIGILKWIEWWNERGRAEFGDTGH